MESLFTRSGIGGKDLSVLAVATGPGSFTSLRIGMAFVKGLSLALNLPVIGIPIIGYHSCRGTCPGYCNWLLSSRQAGTPGSWLVQGEEQQLAKTWRTGGDDSRRTGAIHQETHVICGELNSEERKTLARRWKNIRLAEPAMSIRRPGLPGATGLETMAIHGCG